MQIDPGASALVCRSLTVERPSPSGVVQVLRGLDAVFPFGRISLITGPVGSGKSTLLHALGILIRPASGEIAVGSEVVSRWTAPHRDLWRRNIGFVFQQPRLIAGLTVLENVMVPLVPVERSLSTLRGKARTALDTFGLGNLAGKTPGDLSGGERQRVAWARAFAGTPGILLLDEPTSSQDDSGRQLLARVLHDSAARGAAVVIASHDIALPPALGNEINRWSLVEGRLGESS